MNSSISASEARHWRRLLWRYAAATASLGLVLAALLLVLDPYDTGRFALVPARGVPDFGQRLAFASIARQKGIDAAIFGNSTIQLLDPARLSALSRKTVVSLAVPGTGPREQLAIAGWFRRHHRDRAPSDLVFGIDETWCTSADPIKLSNPFPFWLYSASGIDYALNMMRYKSFEAAWRKVKLLAGRERAARRDGYHDYDTGHEWRSPEFTALSAGDAAASAPFTAIPLLQAFMKRLDQRARVILVFVPRYQTALPAPGSAAAARQDACKSAYRALVQSRPGAFLFDFLVDSPMVRIAANFWDDVHFRGPVAREIEDRLVVALGS